MKGLNLSVEMAVGHFVGSVSATVVFNGVPVMTWFQTEASVGSEPRFTAIAEFGDEGWKIFDVNRQWVPEFVAGRAVPRLEVAQRDLIGVSEEAVRVMFGSALDFEIRDFEGFLYVSQAGVDVLAFPDPWDGGDYHCLLSDEEDERCPDGGLVFTFFSKHRYGWLPWEDGDGGDNAVTFHSGEVEKIAPFAIHALNKGWIQQ